MLLKYSSALTVPRLNISITVTKFQIISLTKWLDNFMEDPFYFLVAASAGFRTALYYLNYAFICALFG